MDGFQIGTLAVYLVVIIAIGFWTKWRETTGDFLIADRSAGTVLTTASLSAVIGGLVLGAYPALGFEYGAGALWIMAGDASGLILLGLVAGRIRSIADEHGFLTLSDYLFLKFDDRTGYLGAILQFAAFLFLLAAQFIVGGQILAELAPIEYPAAVITMGGVTLAYVLLGGYKAVIRTDLVQFAAIFAVFAVLVPLNVDVSELDLQFNIGSPGPLLSLSFYLSGVALFMGADIWQRVYSARSGRVAKTSLFLSAGIWVVLGACLVLLGTTAQGEFGITPDGALFHGLFEVLPKELAGVAIVGLLAALMSTIDTEVFLLATMVAKDFASRRRELKPDAMARCVRVAMVGVTVPAMAMAIYWPDVLGVLFILTSFMMALFPAVLVSLFRPLAAPVAFSSMVVGSLLVTPAFLFGWTDEDTTPIVVLLGAAAVVIVGLFRAAGTNVSPARGS